MAIDSGAFNQWTYKPFADAVDVFDNVTAALGCFDWADPVACLLTKDTAALLNVSDAGLDEGIFSLSLPYSRLYVESL